MPQDLRFRFWLTASFTTLAIFAAGYGVASALHSSLFLVRVVEVSDLPENAPIDAHRIEALANIPLGQTGLFDLDLKAIEKKLLSEPWIREVRLQKRFPQTLAISVTLREPRALLSSALGSVSYIDREGRVFGKLNLAFQSDLPVLSGISGDSEPKIKEALAILDSWQAHQVLSSLELSSLHYDAERGYRALVAYSPKSQPVSRVMVNLGQEIDAEFPEELTRLGRVFKYLSDNGVAARQIWADTGKKIVVKIARRS